MHKLHKKTFSYLNLWTEFSVEGDDRISLDHRACFDRCVSRHRNGFERSLKENDITSNKYLVKVYFNDFCDIADNCCLLSVEELHEWIEDMKKFAEFEFELRPFSVTEDPVLKEGVDVILEFNERPFAEHFLVLEMIKHSYEHMFNFSVYQAVKLRKIINPNELLINLHNMIFCCNSTFSFYSCSDHSIVSHVHYSINDFAMNKPRDIAMMRSAEEIKKMLKHTRRLCSIFDPAVVDVKSINNRQEADAAHFEPSNTKSYKEFIGPRKLCFEQLNKFKYFDDSGEVVQIFSRYFDPRLCKQRLDVYLETYENIRNDKQGTN